MDHNNLSLIALIANASVLVKLVMMTLIIFSLISWAVIVDKYLILKRAKIKTQQFMSQYNTQNNLNQLYQNVSNDDHSRESVAAIFFNGIVEFNKLNTNGMLPRETIIEHLIRTISATLDEQSNNYENHLSILASFGSVSPYIGLFGTVWGIMHAFLSLGNSTSASLSAVAPGIAEALITTAMGLLVAIPAYLGYNFFSNDVNRLINTMSKFGDDFLNLISRKISNSNKK